MLGGTSITALQLLVSLRKDELVQTRVTPTELFQHPTARRLADLVSTRASATDTADAKPSRELPASSTDQQAEMVVLQDGDTAQLSRDKVGVLRREFHCCTLVDLFGNI